jgi:hypothetical protein
LHAGEEGDDVNLPLMVIFSFNPRIQQRIPQWLRSGL